MLGSVDDDEFTFWVDESRKRAAFDENSLDDTR